MIVLFLCANKLIIIRQSYPKSRKIYAFEQKICKCHSPSDDNNDTIPSQPFTIASTSEITTCHTDALDAVTSKLTKIEKLVASQMERQKMIYEQLLHNAEGIKIVKNSVKLKRSVLEDNPILTSFPFQVPIMTVEELENVEKSVTDDDEILVIHQKVNSVWRLKPA